MKRIAIVAAVLAATSGCAGSPASLVELERKCNATKIDCHYGEKPKRQTLEWDRVGQFYI